MPGADPARRIQLPQPHIRPAVWVIGRGITASRRFGLRDRRGERRRYLGAAVVDPQLLELGVGVLGHTWLLGIVLATCPPGMSTAGLVTSGGGQCVFTSGFLPMTCNRTARSRPHAARVTAVRAGAYSPITASPTNSTPGHARAPGVGGAFSLAHR